MRIDQRPPYQELAIDGNDGAGKTTVIGKIADSLKEQGKSVETFAPFRLANEYLGHDIYDFWQDSETQEYALTTLGFIFDQCHKQAMEAKADYVLFDRHWMSILTEVDIDIDLARFEIPKVPVAYLRTKKETSRKRSQNDHDQPWMADDNFDFYHDRLEEIAHKHCRFLLGIYRSDDDVDIETLTRNIIWDLSIRRKICINLQSKELTALARHQQLSWLSRGWKPMA